MAEKDVIVVVQRDALPKEKENLDILLVSTTGAQPVQVYRDIEVVKSVFGPNGPSPNAKIVRKATTLLNQGKTTLATTLVSKFKIVGFEPPTASPATSATFVINFDNDVFAFDAPAVNQKLYVRIGGDDNAVFELTAKVEIENGKKLDAQFKGATFSKGGKTYTAAVTDTVVTFTAAEDGEADSIPERVEIFLDENLSQEFIVTGKKTFTNGRDRMSAGDNLVEAIKAFQADVDNDWYYLPWRSSPRPVSPPRPSWASAPRTTASSIWARPPTRSSPAIPPALLSYILTRILSVRSLTHPIQATWPRSTLTA